MVMAATATKEWTYEMLADLPADGNRYEILDGQLYVTPSPSIPHQMVAFDLIGYFAAYLAQHPVGRGFAAPGDVIIDPRHVVEPDLFVVPLTGQRPKNWKDIKSLLLAIEILSPSTARTDRNKKRLLYQRFDVPEYWIVDTDSRLVERWRPRDTRPEILSESIEWQPSPEHPPLRIDLTAFFARIHDER
jgi:Uma2 family endonuclease